MKVLWNTTSHSIGPDIAQRGARPRSTVHCVEPFGNQTVIVTEQPHRALSVSATADIPLARRWARTVRRIVGVEIDLREPATGRVHVVAHRLPATRTVPLSLALGLGALGVHTTIEES